MSCINISTKRVGGINASAERVGGISVGTSRKAGISVSVGLICAVGYGKYLRVTPKEVQWIDVETSAEYKVLSNLDWNVV